MCDKLKTMSSHPVTQIASSFIVIIPMLIIVHDYGFKSVGWILMKSKLVKHKWLICPYSNPSKHHLLPRPGISDLWNPFDKKKSYLMRPTAHLKSAQV